jgi:hypothetical protein
MSVDKSKPRKKAKPEDRGGFSRIFGDIVSKTSQAAGRALAFMIATGVVLVWAITGPLFQYSDTTQLVINTGTTIVTFPDGVSDPEFPESRQRGDSGQARRTHSRQHRA